MNPGRTAVVLLILALVLGSPRPPARAQAPDPCVAAMALETASPTRTAPDRARKYGRFGADTRDIRDLLLVSSLASAARTRAAATPRARPAADRDDNHIAILEDDNGDLILPANSFDLANSGLRFEPAAGGYTIATTGAEFRSALGRALTLGDDDAVTQAIGFPFDFYGRRFTSLFINSDGNLTFEEADTASTARSIHRVASGAPRIAPFFADLDPSAAGRVFLNSTPDAMTVTWCTVPGFGLSETVSAQTVLFPTGAIEFRFGMVSLRETIVALSPGRVERVTAIDLNRVATQPEGQVAIGELFRPSAELDLIAASRRFYARHPDDFDQLVFFADTDVIADAFAFEATVNNAITGTGLESFDFSTELGSAGALGSVINMDRISKYPDAPDLRIFGENSTLGILAHETGHRWLAHLRFTDANREISEQLLGRQLAHWNFFMDSDGSVMEGNEIEDQGGGVFRTRSTTEKYSLLDQYAMGLVTAAEVPGWFYVESPVSGHTREHGATAGITFNGTRRDVVIQDVIEALGPRVPAAADAPRLHRQAFVFVRRSTAPPDPQDLARLTRIRDQFGPFFSRATENRMTVRTTLP
ncbi:MAG TPA: hypothetical protein VJ691_18265 [Vicinamibacterales bacterium]|nr:hypothetical protein [Vicinamibacterales bacterium]